MTADTIADLYLRLSDARREEALDGREAKLRAKAAEFGWTVGRVIIENDMTPGNGNGNGTLRPASAFKRRKITTPSGRTELRTVRPGFRSMLDDLMAGRANAILVEDLDRTMRQPRDGEDLLDAVELSGATCRSLSGSLTLTGGGTDAERFTARILAATASKSSADTARRVADARERLAGQSWHGGQRPYGFRHDPDAPKYHKTLIIDEDEAKVIRDAATAVLAEGDEKISLKAIARDLRDRGVPTVTGTAWTASTLRDILVKPCVAGIVVSGGAELAAPWPAIIEPDRWRRLRDTLTDPARRTNGQTGNAPRWLVSKMALCGICADGKATVHATSGGGRPAAYRCDEFNHLWRDAAHVDEYVAAVVVERLSRPDVADLLRPPPRPGTDTAGLRAEARRLRDRKHSQMRLHAAGAIDDGDLAAGMKEIRARLAQIDAQLAVSDAPDPLAEFRDRPAAAVWESLPLPRRRAVVRLLMRVTILPAGRKGRGFDPGTVRTEWNQP